MAAASDLALAMPPATAERLFSDGIGRTVKDDIERVRFAAVQKFLRTTSLPIAEIADRCAFPDESSLSRRFLALFGETPSRWRRLARSRRAAGIF